MLHKYCSRCWALWPSKMKGWSSRWSSIFQHLQILRSTNFVSERERRGAEVLGECREESTKRGFFHIQLRLHKWHLSVLCVGKRVWERERGVYLEVARRTRELARVYDSRQRKDGQDIHPFEEGGEIRLQLIWVWIQPELWEPGHQYFAKGREVFLLA